MELIRYFLDLLPEVVAGVDSAIDWLITPLSSSGVGSRFIGWLVDNWNRIYPNLPPVTAEDFALVSPLALMFTFGLVFYLGYSIVKWLLDIVL